MSTSPQRSLRTPHNVAFDISRSSFFQHIKEQRDQIRHHQRTVSEKSGQEIDRDTAMHSWVWRHKD